MNKKPTDDNGDQVSITSQEELSDDNGDTPIPPGRPEVIKKPAAPLFGPKDSDTAHMDATRLYLSEIGSSKLLTAEEEVTLSRQAQK